MATRFVNERFWRRHIFEYFSCKFDQFFDKNVKAARMHSLVQTNGWEAIKKITYGKIKPLDVQYLPSNLD